SDAQVIARGRDHEYSGTTSDEFDVVRCSCGLVYLNPRPDASELATIYPDDYYAYQLIERRLASRGTASLLAKYMTSRAAARLRPYAERVRASRPGPYRILDIGCGDGQFLSLWAKAFEGERLETCGIEMNERAAKIAAEQGHRVSHARIEDSELEPKSMDLVYSFHVIEHVEDPASFMRGIRGALRPGGWVLIDTPNIDTFDFRLFGKRHWGGYHFPRHFTLYDAKTFEALAANTGFRVESIVYCPSAPFWVWTFHSMLRERAPRLADTLFPPVDLFVSGSPWNVALLSVFTAVDLGAIAFTKRCSTMRILLRPVD
ncbi:MAG TPA: class I SAM-dependent methyltransferase, partial [Polyangiaceae bacterium]